MVGSILRWVYFRKKSEFGQFDLFSDLDSRINHLNRILMLFVPIMIFEFLAGFSNLLMQDSSNKSMGLLTIFVGCLLAYGAFVIYKKKKKLLKERMIYE